MGLANVNPGRDPLVSYKKISTSDNGVLSFSVMSAGLCLEGFSKRLLESAPSHTARSLLCSKVGAD
jgi:hypothetical protein